MNRIPPIKRAILAETPAWQSWIWVGVAVVLPTVVRWAIDKGASGIPFVTFFPAVLLVSVFLGWKYGAATAFVSGMVANRLLRETPLLFFVNARDALLVALFFVSCIVIVWAGDSLRRLVRQNAEAQQREESLKRELLHRFRNSLTVIQGIAAQTARHSAPEEFLEKFNARLQALNKANTRLGDDFDAPSDIGALIEDAILPFGADGHVTLDGPPCELPSVSVVPLSLALHELCTNAFKYGALSVPGGRVEISWAIAAENPDQLHLTWQEIGGPKVIRQLRQGLGSLLLRPQNGLKNVQVDYAESGLKCEFVIEGIKRTRAEA